MIRIIVDKLGSGHDDIFLKIDNLPIYTKTGDSYYLLDFLEISDEELKNNNVKDGQFLNYATTKLIDYWNSRIGQAEKGTEIFLPFDFQDEYIGGLLLIETSLGFKTKVVYSDKVHSYEVNKSVFDKVVSDRQIEFLDEEKAEWLISHDQIFNGLEWSKDELKE
ncbi:hypothetical protein GCM10011506_01720 [Marivirga lumbricoides]|uniref:DUF1642 domain-containing protein n=1 Tax=Marivirga lumbricoides TaxID=1046115 RepID=A0ABQ1LA35_9BACT|nr:hypothetical protein GCM10011506_01720 [Marivirga lumbricoides]